MLKSLLKPLTPAIELPPFDGPPRLGPRAFSLKVDEAHAYSPEFLKGDMILVDPDHPARDGDYVLIVTRQVAHDAFLRRLHIDILERRYLIPALPDLPLILMTADMVIVGTVAAKWRLFPGHGPCGPQQGEGAGHD